MIILPNNFDFMYFINDYNKILHNKYDIDDFPYIPTEHNYNLLENTTMKIISINPSEIYYYYQHNLSEEVNGYCSMITGQVLYGNIGVIKYINDKLIDIDNFDLKRLMIDKFIIYGLIINNSISKCFKFEKGIYPICNPILSTNIITLFGFELIVYSVDDGNSEFNKLMSIIYKRDTYGTYIVFHCPKGQYFDISSETFIKLINLIFINIKLTKDFYKNIEQVNNKIPYNCGCGSGDIINNAYVCMVCYRKVYCSEQCKNLCDCRK